MKVSAGHRPFRPAAWLLSVLIMASSVAQAGRFGSTSALMVDSQTAGAGLQASAAGPPQVTPTVLSITVHVGDRCEGAPALTVQNTSGWTQHLSVTASGWLQASEVAVSPSTLGPWASAAVTFTKAAVLGPTEITGEIAVTASPGSHVTVVPLQGQVVKPADASNPPPSPYPGCVSTPRQSSTAEGEEPILSTE